MRESSHDTRHVFTRPTVVAGGLFLACALACSSVNAQSTFATNLTPTQLFPFTASGNVATAGALSATSANIASMGFASTAAGDVKVTAGSLYSASGSSPLPIGVTGTINKAAILPALGRFLGKVIPLVGVGVALVDFAREAGFVTHKNQAGLPVFTRLVGGSSCGPEPAGAREPLPDTTRQTFSWEVFGPGTTPPRSGVVAAGTCQFGYVITSTEGYGSFWDARIIVSVVTLPPAEVAVTNQEFLDAIAARSGWPSSSALSRTVVDLVRSGEALPVTQKTLSGPASVPGPKIVATSPTGVVTTTNTTNNYNYSGDTITTVTTNTSVVNNPPGTVPDTTSTVVTTPTVTPDPPADPCDVNPSRVGCLDIDTPDVQVPKATSTISYAPEDVGFGAGTCPPPVPFRTSIMQGSLDLGPYCIAMALYVRPLVIAFSLLAAFFIVAPVKQ